MDYDSYDAVLHWIFRSTQGDAWFKPSEENISSGVCLRVDPGQFRVFPYENPYLVPFEAAVRSLNPLVAVKLRNAAVHSALATVSDDADAIYIDHDTRIQVLDSVNHLPKADKEQCGAFIRDERVLIVWSDDLDYIVPLCSEFEEKIMKLVWRTRTNPTSILTTSSASPSTTASDVNLNEKNTHQPITVTDAVAAVNLAEKEGNMVPKQEHESSASKWGWSWKLSSKRPLKSKDVEKVTSGREDRPIRLFGPFYDGLGLAFAVFFILSGLAILLEEYLLDHNAIRFVLFVTAPFLFCVSLFFALQIVSNVSFVLGPVAQYHENSRYYSAIKPESNTEVDSQLPHITIEMPVYKESLEETIAPSVFSLKKAMQTYARQGGTSAIFVHDDGLQIIDEAERQKRIAFYANHNIGWVARPGHSSDPDGFKRAGRFKKASNMNYGLQLSLVMEKHILALEASGMYDVNSDSDSLEDKALELAIEEIYQTNGQKWRPWAKNARSLRIGEIILIVDSDTIVPEVRVDIQFVSFGLLAEQDCLRDAARELAECQEVAIIQHESDVMQVAHHYFENGIAHFTRRINKCISMGCANGEVAPFVGHNAFLRWSALQDAAFVDPADGVTKIWSESNVSEDFDMALRLQV
ncbi:hypothetical protein C0993_009561 [Termitomyces sp. T159_Od127]|nr:hypothetical protein C0993_009561 [Termitomyces sp. T159_Od127]